MSALAKPFDYASFDAHETAPSEEATTVTERTYTQAELDDAVHAARQEALENTRRDEVNRQSSTMSNIASALSEAITSAQNQRNAHIDHLTSLAGALVEQCCLSALASKQTQTALTMVQQHLAAESTNIRAVLYVSTNTTARIKNSIKKAVSEIDSGQNITIETDQTLNAGEVRFAWRGGELARLDATVKRQLASIFTNVPHPETDAPTASQKETIL